MHDSGRGGVKEIIALDALPGQTVWDFFLAMGDAQINEGKLDFLLQVCVF